jgi:hypothetical protein
MTAKAVKLYESTAMKFVNTIQTLVLDICRCVCNSAERLLKLFLPSTCLSLRLSVSLPLHLSFRPSIWSIVCRPSIRSIDCPSVCRHEQLKNRYTDFYEIWYLGVRKICRHIPVLLTLDRNYGRFTWRPTCTYLERNWLNIYGWRNVTNKSCRFVQLFFPKVLRVSVKSNKSGAMHKLPSFYEYIQQSTMISQRTQKMTEIYFC